MACIYTSEELVLQVSLSHVFIYQHPLLLLTAISNQFHQMGMPQLPKKDYFSLQNIK